MYSPKPSESLVSYKLDLFEPINYYKEVLNELNQKLMEQADVVDRMVERMCEAENIWIAGSGRSLIAITFGSVRISQMGKRVVVTSDNTYTHPPISDKDVMLAVSGSGKTKSVVEDICTAKRHGVYVSAITGDPKSPVAELSDIYLLLETPSDKYNNSGEAPIFRCMGTPFEFQLFICGEIIANEIGKRLGYKERDLVHSPFG